MLSSTTLSNRGRKVLYATVTEYITTGEPVGAAKLVNRYGLDVSAATVRNTLAELEEQGFLHQPHHSAGRVPTEKGFRIFVSALAKMPAVSDIDQAMILERFRSTKLPKEALPREAGRVLAALTGSATVVAPPRFEDQPLSQARFMQVSPGALLAVLISRAGTVQNRMVPLDQAVDSEQLNRVNNYLAEWVVGRTLGELREILDTHVKVERDGFRSLRTTALQVVDATLSVGSVSPDLSVLIEGQDRLLEQPEFQDASRIRSALRALEDRERLLELVDKTLRTQGVQVFIGSEASLGERPDLSMVSANYSPGGTSAGTVAVIGPTRMDYQKVMPLVGFTARALTDLLEGDDPSNTQDTLPPDTA